MLKFEAKNSWHCCTGNRAILKLDVKRKQKYMKLDDRIAKKIDSYESDRDFGKCLRLLYLQKLEYDSISCRTSIFVYAYIFVYIKPSAVVERVTDLVQSRIENI